MKTIFTISALIFIMVNTGIAQVNPLGVYLDIDGKVNLWESEANRNGNVDDTVYIIHASDTIVDNLRNLKYDHLTFLEAADESWTLPSSGDPSRINDTTSEIYSEQNSYTIYDLLDTTLFYTFLDAAILIQEDSSILNQRKFIDKVRGDGLTDSIVEILKTKLANHINQYCGKRQSYEAREELHLELSHWDTVIDKQAIYDYLVDYLVLYNYEDDKLTSVTGYHWNLGVEIDSVRYDDTGNLIYFSRESIGSQREEFHFEYNENGQVIFAKCFRGGYFGKSDNRLIPDYYLETFQFTYNEHGILKSKSTLQKDGSCYLVNYVIKKRVTTKPKLH